MILSNVYLQNIFPSVYLELDQIFIYSNYQVTGMRNTSTDISAGKYNANSSIEEYLGLYRALKVFLFFFIVGPKLCFSLRNFSRDIKNIWSGIQISILLVQLNIFGWNWTIDRAKGLIFKRMWKIPHPSRYPVQHVSLANLFWMNSIGITKQRSEVDRYVNHTITTAISFLCKELHQLIRDYYF